MANHHTATSHRTGFRKPRQRVGSPSRKRPEVVPDVPHISDTYENGSLATEDVVPTDRNQSDRLSHIEDVTELDIDLLFLSDFTLPPLSPTPSSNPSTPSQKHLQPAALQPKRTRPRPHTPTLHIPQSVSPSLMRPVRLLIASLGNPSPYHSTRHSAAHILLKSLAQNLNFPSLTKNKSYGGGSTSFGADVGFPEYTLWQSGSLMNISGIGLLQAWRTFDATLKRDGFDGVEGLVVLHDELELEPGKIKVRRGEGSARGHNGIKSVQASLKGAGVLTQLSKGDRLVKIGIGIGRPMSREKEDVSAYVLGQVTRAEKEKLEGKVREGVEVVLKGEVERLGRL